MSIKTLSLFPSLIILLSFTAAAQISPGPLAAVHSHLEGLSNCTQCHTLGDKVTNDKCLACHTELKSRTDQNKGYHSSAQIRGKPCYTCHNDHHGVNFQILRFNKDNFNHTFTGYNLEGAHAKKTCTDCHKPANIQSKTIRNKKFTYLGLNTTCLSCHTDYHQQTLSPSCTNCHGMDAFKPVVKFNHATTNFPLNGMHESVPCEKCHVITTKNNVKFQEFAGVLFKNCTNCHADPHKNQFGQNCVQCHSEASFHTIKGMSNFDHSKTGFVLEEKHRSVPCNSCHKTNLTNPVRHDRCTDCHADYHKGQFATQNGVQDCSGCHSTKGFNLFSFTIDQHNAGKFKLEGAHVATPCIECHKKQAVWSFREIGIRCVDCHKDVHEPFLDKKYYPESSCQNCHNPSLWGEITFDHSITGWALSGAHATPTCRTCHVKTDSLGNQSYRFAGLSSTCTNCHADNHYKQFEENGVTNCQKCHNFTRWNIDNFDHNTTAFKLDGKHQNVPCSKCHKKVTVQDFTYVLYKIKDWRCESCH